MTRRGAIASAPFRGLMTLTVVLVPFMVAVAAAPGDVPAALEPGTQAPELELRSIGGGTFRLDEPTTRPTLLVFSYIEDRHSSHTLALLDDFLERHESFDEHVRRAWVVTGRGATGRAAPPEFLHEANRWTVLLDGDGDVAKRYAFIASPTLYLIEPGGRIAAAHAGFDPGLVEHVRRELAGLLDPELARRLQEPAPEPNMMLQMGRRMASRGLWERALGYYRRAEEEGPLSGEARLELAEIHAYLGETEEALKILEEVSPEDADPARIDALRREIERRARDAEPPKPPVINR